MTAIFDKAELEAIAYGPCSKADRDEATPRETERTTTRFDDPKAIETPCPAYEKPAIEKLQSGLMNKFGVGPGVRHRARTEIDGVPVEELIRAHGSPLFVFSETKLVRQIRRVRRAFQTRYPDATLAWSYKTNYLDAICAIMHREGSWAEVVSALEYQKARALGVPGDHIIFNGPYKPVPALETAIAEQAIVNIDHDDEIEDLELAADSVGRQARVGIRINLDAGIYPQWSRFGYNLENGQALAAARRIVQGGRGALVGLHCHIGTFILDPDAYARQVTKLARFMAELEAELGVTIEFLDIGGGLPSKNRLKGTYLPADCAVPDLEEYAEAICTALLKALPNGRSPKLFIEAGRALVDEAGTLIASAHASKRLPDGRRAYVLDAGLNLLFTSLWYNYDIQPGRPVVGQPEPCVLYGPGCMNIDVVGEGLSLPSLPRGTPLVIGPVGAYNVTQWMQFIHARPAIVMISEAGAVERIRQPEDLSDWLRREELPPRLRELPWGEDGACGADPARSKPVAASAVSAAPTPSDAPGRVIGKTRSAPLARLAGEDDLVSPEEDTVLLSLAVARRVLERGDTHLNRRARARTDRDGMEGRP